MAVRAYLKRNVGDTQIKWGERLSHKVALVNRELVRQPAACNTQTTHRVGHTRHPEHACASSTSPVQGGTETVQWSGVATYSSSTRRDTSSNRFTSNSYAVTCLATRSNGIWPAHESQLIRKKQYTKGHKKNMRKRAQGTDPAIDNAHRQVARARANLHDVVLVSNTGTVHDLLHGVRALE